MDKLFSTTEKYLRELQGTICNSLEEIDGKQFLTDNWKRKEGGGGVTKVIVNGNIFEKGGVNFSSVHGMMSEDVAKQLHTSPQNFAACGLSIILHPFSPRIPTIHMNLRCFSLEKGKIWFGGGIDLTPYYPLLEDFKHFHKILKDACNSVVENSYKTYKKNCDEYFYIKHRHEMRGIGGIFFDYLDGNEINLRLAKSVGDCFLNSYMPIVEKRKDEKYSPGDKKFQLVRRGRYVEFNLIYDRGTLFGLKTEGNIESILISLPTEVNYIYNYLPRPNSPHSVMMKYYQPANWI